MATGEALNDAIERGGDLDDRRAVGMEAFASEHAISVTIGDSGRWSKDSAATSQPAGRGLRLIHGLSDDVRTVRTPLATRVTMTHRLGPGGRVQRLNQADGSEVRIARARVTVQSGRCLAFGPARGGPAGSRNRRRSAVGPRR